MQQQGKLSEQQKYNATARTTIRTAKNIMRQQGKLSEQQKI